MQIEFLYWAECPSHEEALQRLRSVLAEEGLPDRVELREVRDDAEAEAHAFPGSPTIRIDGRDVDPEGAEEAGIGLACRVYRTPEGRITPLPPVELLRG